MLKLVPMLVQRFPFHVKPFLAIFQKAVVEAVNESVNIEVPGPSVFVL